MFTICEMLRLNHWICYSDGQCEHFKSLKGFCHQKVSDQTIREFLAEAYLQFHSAFRYLGIVGMNVKAAIQT